MDQVQEKLTNFFSKYKNLKYKRGASIIRPDDPIDYIYFLKEGNVRQYLISEHGEEVSINIFKPFSFFPIMLILGEKTNSHYFEAMDKVEIYKAPQADVVKFLKSDNEVLFDLTKRFAMGLSSLSERLGALMYENAHQRVTSLLFYLANKFGKNGPDGVTINLTLSHSDIASWVNLTRETTSRELEKLAKEGLISYNKKQVIVKDPQKLI